MRYSINDLLYLMSRLRDPELGCPWDLKQTSKTIINHSIEEVYELADAIENGNDSDTRAELGDVLFQVIFLAHIAEQDGGFSFAEVVQTLCEKLIRRHPHVFVNGSLYDDQHAEEHHAESRSPISDAQVKEQWEAIKVQERVNENKAGLFDDVPLALPALLRATKLQKRASTVGFDWPDVSGALQKLREEIEELEAVIDSANTNKEDTLATSSQPSEIANTAASSVSLNMEQLTEELGDVLFSCVNVARKTGVNSEQALRRANDKFVYRVGKVLNKLPKDIHRSDISSEQLDSLWDAVKREHDEL